MTHTKEEAKIGLRVKTSRGRLDNWTGTIVGWDDRLDLALIRRDDGKEGSGPKGEWRSNQWEPLEPLSTVEYPIAFKPLLDAVIAEASARRELKAQNEATQEARNRLYEAKQTLQIEQEKAAKL